MKILRRIALAVALLVVLAVVGGILFANQIAAGAIAQAGTYALGVDTKVGGASVGVVSGKFGLEDLSVANPEGFSNPEFLALHEGKLEVPVRSLLGQKVEIPLLELDGVAIDLDREGGKTNYGVILDNLERLSSGEGGGGEAKGGGGKGEKAPGKTFVVREILIRDVTATVKLLPVGGELTRITLQIPEIKMADVGQDVTLSQLVSVVVRTILTATLQAGEGVIPTDMLKDLGGRLGNLGAVPLEIGGDVIKNVTGALEGTLGKAAGEVLEGAGQTLEKGLGGLLKKKKDE